MSVSELFPDRILSNEMRFWAEGGEFRPGETRVLTQALKRWVEDARKLEDCLRIIGGVVDAYLDRGEGGGGRAICLRIKQTLEHK